jgi:hypothetical protein
MTTTDADMLAVPPNHLSDGSKALWLDLLEAFPFAAKERDLLRVGLEARDRAIQARRALRKHGLTYDSPQGSPVARPEVGIERQSQRLWTQVLKQLGVPGEAASKVHRGPHTRKGHGRRSVERGPV